MPSTLVALTTTSQLSSNAFWTAALSVVQNGLPVHPAQNTISPALIRSRASLLKNEAATFGISSEVNTLALPQLF